jgi:hypothetical protein
MWVSFEYEALKKRPVEIVSFSLLDCESVIIDFGPELPEN